MLGTPGDAGMGFKSLSCQVKKTSLNFVLPLMVVKYDWASRSWPMGTRRFNYYPYSHSQKATSSLGNF